MEENTPIPKEKSRIVKNLAKGFLFVIVFFIIIIGTITSLLIIYEEEVKSAIVKELNKHLKAEVRIDPENIDLTILHSFPDCALRFKNVVMLEALPLKHRDTLMHAGELDLYFNVMDLWHKKYNIQKVKLSDARVNLSVFKNGKNNYTFWDNTTAKTTQQNDSMRFNLQLLQINNSRLLYKNKQQLIKSEINIKTLSFSGSFAENVYDMRSQANLFIVNITQNKSTYLKNKQLEFDVDLNVNQNRYEFKKANLTLNKMAIELEGGFLFNDSLSNLSLRYAAPQLDISSVLSLLPQSHKRRINDYESDGNFYATGKVNFSGANTLYIESSFGVKNGEVNYKPNNTRVTDVNLDGFLKYSPEESELSLNHVVLKLNNDVLAGNCTIRDFNNPYLQVKTEAKINLQNLLSFWPIDTLTELKGQLELNTTVEGMLKDLKGKTFSEKVNLELNAAITDLEARFKGDEKTYAINNCSLSVKNREVEVHDLKLKRGSSDIKVNGKIPGLFNYLADNTAPLIITGNFYSEFIQLEDFLATGAGQKESNDAPIIPANVEFKLNAAILKFKFATFDAKNITGEIDIKNQKAIISDTRLETMEGEAEINAYADNSNNRLDVVLQSKLKGINIHNLFADLNNFGQTTLIDKNLKGYINADIDFSGQWNNRLEANLKSIKSMVNLSVDKGELIDFKPLLSLSKYVDIKDLQHIRFSNLQSVVEIKNTTIYLPKTSIKNSALNIEFWGSHTFNNDIDYHLQLLINDLLAKKRKNSDDEFGPVANDPENRRSAFVLMTGNIDNPVIKYDRQGLKQKIKNDIKQEKQTIRQLLKEELGLFKKDTVKRSTKKEEQLFELEKKSPKNKQNADSKKKEEDDDDF